MTVRGTEELKNWILGFGPYMEVLRPPPLRDEVAAAVKAMAALYGPDEEEGRRGNEQNTQ